jgi:hypothetical protein
MCFLASDEAAYLTGAIWAADGADRDLMRVARLH